MEDLIVKVVEFLIKTALWAAFIYSVICFAAWDILELSDFGIRCLLIASAGLSFKEEECK